MRPRRSTLFRALLTGWGVLVLTFMCAPILVILPIAFSSGPFLSYPLPGLSLRWFHAIAEPFPWVFAFKNSIFVALCSTVAAVALGTPAAYGLTSAQFPARKAVVVLLLTPMVVPIVIGGLGLYFFLAKIGLLGTYAGLIVAHTALGIPFVVVTVAATLKGFDRNLVRAAESLGSPPLATFRQVTLPIILPGVLSGAIFAFVASFDEVVVALFVSSPSTLTLPRQIFSGLRDQVTPALVAMAAVLTAISVVFLVTVEILQRRTQRIMAAPVITAR